MPSLPPQRQVRASMAFASASNRPQPLWQPPPTACLTASGAASEVPSLLMHPWGAPPRLDSPRPETPLPPFQCLRLTAKLLLRRLRCQEGLSFKIHGPPSAGTIGGPWEEGVPANPPPLPDPPPSNRPSAAPLVAQGCGSPSAGPRGGAFEPGLHSASAVIGRGGRPTPHSRTCTCGRGWGSAQPEIWAGSLLRGSHIGRRPRSFRCAAIRWGGRRGGKGLIYLYTAVYR